MKNRFLIAYVVVALIHLVAILSENRLVADCSKVLLIPMLIGYAFQSFKNHKPVLRLLLIALFFCWAGDTLLIFTEQNELFFLLGLAAFLLGHIGYIFTFRKSVDTSKPVKSLPAIYYGLPIIYAVGLLIFLLPKLGDMAIPVIAYAIVISMMCVAAMWRWSKTTKFSFMMVTTGAIVFVISVSLIAINKFHTAFSTASILIMITYIKAQYLIVVGLKKHYFETA